MRFFLALIVVIATAGPAAAQQPAAAQPNGSAVFDRACASCHQPGQTATPTPEALRAFAPEAIVNSLTNGKMSVQGAGLSPAERAAVAQFLTGRAPSAWSLRSMALTSASRLARSRVCDCSSISRSISSEQ